MKKNLVYYTANEVAETFKPDRITIFRGLGSTTVGPGQPEVL